MIWADVPNCATLSEGSARLWCMTNAVEQSHDFPLCLCIIIIIPIHVTDLQGICQNIPSTLSESHPVTVRSFKVPPCLAMSFIRYLWHMPRSCIDHFLPLHREWWYVTERMIINGNPDSLQTQNVSLNINIGDIQRLMLGSSL